MASNLPSSATTSGTQTAGGLRGGRPPQYFSRTGMGWPNGAPVMPGPDPAHSQAAWSNSQVYQYPPPSMPPPVPDSSYPPLPPPMMAPPHPPAQPSSMYYPSSQYSQYSQQPLPPPRPPPPPPSPPPNSAIPPPPPSSPPPPPPSAPPPPPPAAKLKEGGQDRGRHDRDRDRDRRVSREGDHQTSSKHHKPPIPTNRSNGPPGSRVETEEERRLRKKKEMERQRPEDRHGQHQKESHKSAHQKSQVMNSGSKGHERSSGSRMGERRTPASLLNAERMENRLKKPTTFLCRMKFRNELPDPTAQPKFMTIKRDKDRFARYSITSLEKLHKPKLYTDHDLGIPLDLLDLSIYNPPKEKPPLAPEDEELLRDDEPATPLRKDGLKRKDRPSDQGLSWLVKTQYISPLSNEATRQSLTEKQAKELRETREGRNLLENVNSRERQIKEILASFEASRTRPVHATNKSLHPVEIMPLLPYFDRHEDEFVVVNFDGEPTQDSEMFRKVDKSVRDAHESKAIMKSFVAPTSDAEKPDRFLGYMVPTHNDVTKDICEEDEDISYTWVREYNWELKGESANDPSTYLVAFDDNVARYLPAPTKLTLRKRRSKEGRPSEEIEQFAPPSKVTVRRADTVAVIERKDPAVDLYSRRGASSSRGADMDMDDEEDGYGDLDAGDAEMAQSSGAEDDAYD